MDATTHLTPDLAVWHAYRRELADNGESGDARISLCVAPSASEDNPGEHIYAADGGGCWLLGWLDRDSGVMEIARESDYSTPADWLDANPWMVEALEIDPDDYDNGTAHDIPACLDPERLMERD